MIKIKKYAVAEDEIYTWNWLWLITASGCSHYINMQNDYYNGKK